MMAARFRIVCSSAALVAIRSTPGAGLARAPDGVALEVGELGTCTGERLLGLLRTGLPGVAGGDEPAGRAGGRCEAHLEAALVLVGHVRSPLYVALHATSSSASSRR